MPEKTSKAQSKKTDQKSVKVEDASKKESKNQKSESPKTPEPKTKSRLPNKSLTDAEVAKKSEKAKEQQVAKVEQKNEQKAQKPESSSNKANIKVITQKPSIKAKSPKSTAETIVVKTKPSTKNGKTSSSTKKTSIKVIKVPKVIGEVKATNSRAQKPVTEPEVKKTETKKAETQKTKKLTNQKSFNFLSIFSKVIAIILGFSSLFFIGMLIHIDILPMKYLLLIVILILIVASSCSFLLWHQKVKGIVKTPLDLVSIIFSCIYLVVGGYIAQATGFLDSLKPQEYISEQYYLIVKNDSALQDIKALKGKTVGTFDEGIELYQEAIKKLNSTISVELEAVKSVHTMTEGLLSNEFDAAFLSAAHKSVIDEDSADFSKNTRILYTIEVKVKADAVEEPKVNVTTEPFTIYISGNDSYGDLAARGLSDVNMLVTVNPVTHEILLTSIPRDCFVQLHGTTGGKDKLTHAGLYGVQMSILTIEELLDINIDYYVKLNFPALVGLVDAIGGIDIYSDKTFKPLHGNKIVYEGMNHFDGAMALAFARERMAYTYGDRHRVQNQRDVIIAIIQKVSSSSVILTKTNEILNNLSSNLDTNISKSEISSLVKLQLDSMPSWKIAEYMVNGSDLYTYTYTFGDMPRYVMPPFPESIQTAHNYITGIMEGKTIEELGIPAPENKWK